MLSYCTNYLATMPDITVYMNCDTRLAVNLRMFDLGDDDEFIFVIKNYDFIDSPYAFLFRAHKTDIDENGEVIFKIDPDASKNIKPGAFYNFSVLINAFNRNKLTEYKKLTENGRVIIEYGAHDLALPSPAPQPSPFNEISSVQLEEVTEIDNKTTVVNGAILGINLEKVE